MDLFMQIHQPISLPLDETGETVTNERVGTVVATQVALPDERVSRERGSEDSATQPVFAPTRGHRQFVLPPWPTSQAGPMVTALSPGQRLVSTRTDQVTYDFYNQEQGHPGHAPADPARENSTK